MACTASGVCCCRHWLGRAVGTVVLVGAPHMPFGPALDAQGVHPKRLLWVAVALPVQRLWSTEQALRCADVDAVVAWLDPVRPDQLRRLQMAAAGFAKLLFVVRPAQAQSESSPAVLRLWVSSCSDPADALEVRAIKRRGPPMEQSLRLAARPARLAKLLAASQSGQSHALGCAASRNLTRYLRMLQKPCRQSIRRRPGPGGPCSSHRW
jgi:protein ImuA